MSHFVRLLAGAALVSAGSAALALPPAPEATPPRDGAARLPADRRNFVACPIVQDTDTVPCWLAEYDGKTYFLGIQTDSGGWSPPYLGHRVLVEGKLAGGPNICGGIPLTSQYPASPIPSGKANGRPLPNPPVTSVMRNLDPSCNTLLPSDPRYHIEGRRGPGPNTAASAFRRPPAPPAAPRPQWPYQARTFTLTYDFDSELASRTIRNALNAVLYARAVAAKRITIVGYRGATLLSDGSTLAEMPKIAQARAQELAGTLRELGLPKSATLVVHWDSEPQPADGITDPERRRSEIIVTP
jgi:outer membrane protein OmpA-like peptidoglycan-associated protein